MGTRRDVASRRSAPSGHVATTTLQRGPFSRCHFHVIGDPNQADAICDRLLHDAHRIELKGRSMRRTHDAPKTRTRQTT